MIDDKYLKQIKDIVQSESKSLHKLVHDEITPLKKEMRGFWNFMVEMKEQMTTIQENVLQIQIRLSELKNEIDDIKRNQGELKSDMEHVIARVRRVEEEVKDLKRELKQIGKMFTEDNLAQGKDLEKLKEKMIVLENEVRLLKTQ